jgi:hypothetical protein
LSESVREIEVCNCCEKECVFFFVVVGVKIWRGNLGDLANLSSETGVFSSEGGEAP